MLACIGEQFDEGDEVCGVTVNIRNGKDRLELWSKTAANEALQMSVGKQLKQMLDIPDSNKIGFVVFVSTVAWLHAPLCPTSVFGFEIEQRVLCCKDMCLIAAHALTDALGMLCGIKVSWKPVVRCHVPLTPCSAHYCIACSCACFHALQHEKLTSGRGKDKYSV